MDPVKPESPTRILREGTVDLRKHFPTQCPLMIDLLATLGLYVRSNRPIFLFGEPGCGKTFLARAIHNASKRSEGPFVHLEVASSDPNLLRSEWFGHVKGAYTGALTDHTGLFETADEGTLFLDDVFDLPLAAQGHFLRALEYREISPVGATEPRFVDVRYLFASNRSFEEVLAHSEQWRYDLPFRMGLCHFTLPSLRDRIEDIPLLASSMLGAIASRDEMERTPEISDSALRALAEWPWRANLREMFALLDRAVPLAREGVILPEHLKPLRSAADVARPVRRLDAIEREEALRAIAAAGANKREAAKLLGVSPHKLYRILRRRVS